jgi:hypothetical protein
MAQRVDATQQKQFADAFWSYREDINNQEEVIKDITMMESLIMYTRIDNLLDMSFGFNAEANGFTYFYPNELKVD